MTPVRLQHVDMRYGAVHALDDLSFELQADQVTVLIGRSGCGKSTLLRLCNGIVRPDSGSIEVFGTALSYRNLVPLRRRIGYAMQGTGLFPHLSAQDNITLLAELEHWSATAIAQRLEQLRQLVKLDRQSLTRLPYQLSGGQQQRAGLCRALFLRPELLLLDEAFSASDPLTRDEIHQQWLAMRESEAVTTLLVTHDMHEALLLGDRIIVMESGKIVEDRLRRDLLSSYPNLAPNQLLRQLMAGETP